MTGESMLRLTTEESEASLAPQLRQSFDAKPRSAAPVPRQRLSKLLGDPQSLKTTSIEETTTQASTTQVAFVRQSPSEMCVALKSGQTAAPARAQQPQQQLATTTAHKEQQLSAADSRLQAEDALNSKTALLSTTNNDSNNNEHPIGTLGSSQQSPLATMDCLDPARTACNNIDTQQTLSSHNPKSNNTTSTITSNNHNKGVVCNSKPRTAADIEFKSGVLNKKRICDANGKVSLKGRRAWKRVHVTITDLHLIKRPVAFKPSQPQPQPALNTIDPFDRPLKNSSQADKPKQHCSAPSNGNKQTIVTCTTKKKCSALCLSNAFAVEAKDYLKRQNVFRLTLVDEAELLFEASSRDDMLAWIDAINFAAACLSPSKASSLLSSTSGDTLDCAKQVARRSRRNKLTRKQQLEASQQTKMLYWDQLVYHDARLQALRAELQTQQKQLTAVNDELYSTTEEGNNSKTSKKKTNKRQKLTQKQINDKKKVQSTLEANIQCLEREIVRYNYYVECMRRKSNSEAAIILSKHPEIASMKPSSELLK